MAILPKIILEEEVKSLPLLSLDPLSVHLFILCVMWELHIKYFCCMKHDGSLKEKHLYS